MNASEWTLYSNKLTTPLKEGERMKVDVPTVVESSWMMRPTAWRTAAVLRVGRLTPPSYKQTQRGTHCVA